VTFVFVMPVTVVHVIDVAAALGRLVAARAVVPVVVVARMLFVLVHPRRLRSIG
jgi:hypothetical protein